MSWLPSCQEWFDAADPIREAPWERTPIAPASGAWQRGRAWASAALNDQLRLYHLDFAYRVLDKVVTFLISAEANRLSSPIGLGP